MGKINKIINNGTNITKHYLKEENELFKIYRYKTRVYAIRYEDSQPVDYVSMWVSHKDENIGNIDEYKKLGHGVQGVVYEKTKDKVMKIPHGRHQYERGAETNARILEQKFFLKDKGIQKYFVLGLWNIKNKKNVRFYMPKEQRTDFNEMEPLMVEEFILALKTLNDSGYRHPDLASRLTHFSPQNLFPTKKVMKAIDLDSGFGYDSGKYDKDKMKQYRLHVRDQWIYVFNYLYWPIDEEGDRVEWRTNIMEWYKKHNDDQALSDHPEVLLRFYHEGVLSLPKKLIDDLHEALLEDLLGDIKPKKYSREVNAIHFFSPKKQKAYEGFKGYVLKQVIIKELRDSLVDITTAEELEKKKSDFLDSPEMKILDRAQSWATKAFGLTTSSHKEVEAIFQEEEERMLLGALPFSEENDIVSITI